MHPLGLYLAATDSQREYGWNGAEHTRFAKVDALPVTEPEPTSRIARLAWFVRRRVVLRTSRA